MKESSLPLPDRARLLLSPKWYFGSMPARPVSAGSPTAIIDIIDIG